MTTAVAVTGASGRLGGRVARRLAAAGVATRLLGRDPARLPELHGAEHALPADYADGEAMRRALDGAETLFLVSAHESSDRVRAQHTAVDAAIAAGVERIVYVSFLSAAPEATFTFARDHWHTEEYIRAVCPRHTFLRDSMYLEQLPMLVGADGVIRGPAGQGRVAGVAHDDVADVAVAVLLGQGHDGLAYDVTGPVALTLAEVAEELRRFAGRTISYEAETDTEAYASRAGTGAPDWEIAGWVTSYEAIATGEMNEVTSVVPDLTGSQAQSFADYLTKNPDSYRRLVAAR